MSAPLALTNLSNSSELRVLTRRRRAGLEGVTTTAGAGGRPENAHAPSRLRRCFGKPVRTGGSRRAQRPRTVPSPRLCLSVRAPGFGRWPAVALVTLGSLPPSPTQEPGPQVPGCPGPGRSAQPPCACVCVCVCEGEEEKEEASAEEDKDKTMSFALGIYPKARTTGSSTYLSTAAVRATARRWTAAKRPSAAGQMNTTGPSVLGSAVVSHTEG